MILKDLSGRFVLIAEPVVEAIAAFAPRTPHDLEAGGVLIGSYRGRHIEVAACTTPMPLDLRTTRLFDRRDPSHARIAAEAWRSSDRTQTYVGEWHTHPEDDPVPSSLDQETWSAIVRRSAAPVVFMIVGMKSVTARIGDGALMTDVERVE